MKMFFKIITKIKIAKKMIYITEFVANSDDNFPKCGESVLMVGQSHASAYRRWFTGGLITIPVIPVEECNPVINILHLNRVTNVSCLNVYFPTATLTRHNHISA